MPASDTADAARPRSCRTCRSVGPRKLIEHDGQGAFPCPDPWHGTPASPASWPDLARPEAEMPQEMLMSCLPDGPNPTGLLLDVGPMRVPGLPDAPEWDTEPPRILAYVPREVAERLEEELRDARDERDAARRMLAQRERQGAEVARLRAELAAVKADPQARLADDGTVTVDWPDGAVSCLVTRELLDKMVAERNKLTSDLEIVSTSSVGAHALLDDAQAEVERQQGLVGEALDLALRYLPPAAPPDPGRDPEGMAELLRIKREAGLTS